MWYAYYSSTAFELRRVTVGAVTRLMVQLFTPRASSTFCYLAAFLTTHTMTVSRLLMLTFYLFSRSAGRCMFHGMHQRMKDGCCEPRTSYRCSSWVDVQVIFDPRCFLHTRCSTSDVLDSSVSASVVSTARRRCLTRIQLPVLKMEPTKLMDNAKYQVYVAF